MLEQSFHYGERRIPYKVIFVPGGRNRISIHVHPDGAVQVDAPMDTPLPEIKHAVYRRARWLSHQLDRIKDHGRYVLPREYVSGESHFYLGRRYVLKVLQNGQEAPSVKLLRGQLRVVTASGDSGVVKGLLWAWYKSHALAAFDRRLDALWPKLDWVEKKPAWRLLAMKKQWGSCSPKGGLSLNPHLVKAPPPCIDYVLLHELCHLKFHNHSPSYYRLLSRHMPGWEGVKARLDGMAELFLNV